MGRKKKSVVAASGVAPTATELSLQAAIQNLKTLNFLLLKETKDLREQISQLRFELGAITADNRIADGIQRDVCGVIFSSHLASVAEECAALLRKAGDELAAEKAAAEEKREMLCSTEKKLLAVSKEKTEVEKDLKLSVEEKRMQLHNLEDKLLLKEEELTQNSTSLFAAESKCRSLQEQGKVREELIKTVALRADSLERLVEEKEVLILKLTKENEEMKMREMHDKGLLEENKQATTHLAMLYEDLIGRKDAEIKRLKAEVESNASKFIYLEKKWCCKHQITSLHHKRSKLRDSKWFYPAAIAVSVVVSFALAARGR